MVKIRSFAKGNALASFREESKSPLRRCEESRRLPSSRIALLAAAFAPAPSIVISCSSLLFWERSFNFVRSSSCYSSTSVVVEMEVIAATQAWRVQKLYDGRNPRKTEARKRMKRNFEGKDMNEDESTQVHGAVFRLQDCSFIIKKERRGPTYPTSIF